MEQLEETVLMETPSVSYKECAETKSNSKMYRYKVAVLLSLRCALEGHEDGWIFLNANDECFYDIILHQGSITYVVQLIHDNRRKPKPILEKEFLAPTGDFSLLRYLQMTLKQSNNSKITQCLENKDNVYFVLFTNRDVEVCEVLKLNSNDSVVNFLNSRSNTKLYKFDTDQLSRFLNTSNLKNLYLFANQIYIKNIDKQIMEELKKIAEHFNLLQIDIKQAAEKFSNFIMKFFKGFGDENECLTKQDLLRKVTELFLSNYEVNLEQCAFRYYEQEHLWSEIVQTKTLTVIEPDKHILSFLMQCVGSQVRKYSKESANLWVDNISDENVNLFYQEHESLTAQLVKMVDDLDKITSVDIYKCLWLTKQLPLLLEVKTMHHFNDILLILKLSNYYYEVVILNKSGEDLPSPINEKSVKYFYSLQDLDEKERNKVLKQEVELQGRSSAILEDLLDERMFHYIKCKDIINILLEDFNIGNDLKPLPEYFIERNISKIFLQLDVLDKIQDELFLIEEHSENCLSSLSAHHLNICKLKDLDFDKLNEYRIVTSSEKFTGGQIKKLNSFTERAIHHLSIYRDKHLEWKSSYGSVKKIKEFQVDLEDTEKDSVTGFMSKLVIISAVAGTGKSLLMDYIARQIETRNWVLRVDLKAHQQYYEKNKYVALRSSAKHLEYFKNAFFSQFDCVPNLVNEVFEKLRKEKNIVVFFDGFDEVPSSYRAEVIGIINSLRNEAYCIFITTRPQVKSDLEEEFDILANTLTPFSMNEQKEFLTKYLCNFSYTDLDLFLKQKVSDKLLEVLNENSSNRDAVLVGTPLQIKLIADAFSEDLKNRCSNKENIDYNKNFDLLILYQSFMNKKIQILDNEWGQKLQGVPWYSVFALKLLFPSHNQQIDSLFKNSTDVVQPKHEDLVRKIDHWTCVEYLAAQWMSENLNSSNKEIKATIRDLIQERFTKGYEFLFNIFDRLTAKQCNLHLAIINGEMAKAERIIDSDSTVIHTTDTGGRTVLHLIALYGIQYPPLFKNIELFKTFEAQKFLNSRQFNFDAMLDLILKVPNKNSLYTNRDALRYSPLEYALANRSLTIANKIIAKIYDSTVINVELPFKMKRHYLGYCALLNYNFLLDLLLPYFACRDLLLGKIYIYQRVDSYLHALFKTHTDCSTILQYKVAFRERTLLDFLTTKTANMYSGWVDDYYSDLRYAVCFGSIANVKILLIRRAEINQQDADGNTALHYAVLHAKPKVVEMLVCKGANVDAINVIGNTPLHEAVKYSHTKNLRKLDCVKLLISHTMNINTPSKFGRSAFHIASSIGDIEILNLFLSKSVDINKQDADGRTPLFYATWKNNLAAVKLLIANGADVNAENSEGWTALHHAAVYGYNDIAAEILSNDFKINKQDDSGKTVLMIALWTRKLEFVKLLVSNGANINIQNNEGSTAFHIAAENGFNDIVLLMLSKGADIEKQDNFGLTPFLRAVSNRRVETIRLLISNGADVNAVQTDGRTALHLSSYFGYNDIVSVLLSEGVDIDKQDNSGETSIFCAINGNQIDTAKLLIANGANINIEDESGETALHCAAYFDRNDILCELLLKGANINNKSNHGETALANALLNSKVNSVKLLISNDAEIDPEDARGRTAVHHAAKWSCSNTLTEILSQNVDVNKQDNNGNTPLMYAVMENKIESVKLLISNGAEMDIENKIGRTIVHYAAKWSCILSEILPQKVNINKQDSAGNTPLFYAVMTNKIDSVKLLLSNGAKVNMENKNGCTVLHFAARRGFNDILYEILLQSVDIDKQNKNRCTPLFYAVGENKMDSVKLLVSKGAQINIENKLGRTIMHIAAGYGYDHILTEIISKNANVNKQDNIGNTPIFCAVIENKIDTVKLLISEGAQINAENIYGRTILHFAAKRGFNAILSATFSKTSELDKQDCNGNTPLLFAVRENKIDTAKLLISNGANVSIKNKNGDTVFDIARKNNFSDILAELPLRHAQKKKKRSKKRSNVV